MKKLILLITLGVTMSMAIDFKASLITAGKHYQENTLGSGVLSYPTDSSYAFSIESNIFKDDSYGIGMTYQFQNQISSNPDAKFQYIPFYLYYKMPAVFGLPINLVCHLGMNLHLGEGSYGGSGSTFNGGIYYAFGASFKIMEQPFEFLYTRNDGKVEKSGTSTAVYASNYLISWIYSF